MYITYPKTDEKKQFTPSTFMRDLKNVVNTFEIDAAKYDSLIASERELLSSIKKDELLSGEMNNRLTAAGFEPEKILEDINIDEQRMQNPFDENPYNGYLSMELNEESLEKLKKLSERTYSATQLEEYAKCPFQYFLRRILFVQTIEEPTEEIEAFELGSIIHSILYTFYKTLKEQNRKIENCSDEEFAEFVQLIFSIAKKKTEHINFSSPYSFFEYEKIFGINGNLKHSILYKFLEEERKDKEGFNPEFFEIAFGKKANSSVEVKLNDISFRGKIDRIDVNDEKNLFKVIDYKLGGRKPSKEDLSLGISLQLPLYLYASKILLKAEFDRELTPAAAEIYSLKIFRE
ncbi:MAG: PD-(D/E)XK nuclease family protein, partial [Ignavibacterium sp.]